METKKDGIGPTPVQGETEIIPPTVNPEVITALAVRGQAGKSLGQTIIDEKKNQIKLHFIEGNVKQATKTTKAYTELKSAELDLKRKMHEGDTLPEEFVLTDLKRQDEIDEIKTKKRLRELEVKEKEQEYHRRQQTMDSPPPRRHFDDFGPKD